MIGEMQCHWLWWIEEGGPLEPAKTKNTFSPRDQKNPAHIFILIPYGASIEL